MDDNDYVLAFDHFYTTNHIQILKSLLPFIEGKHAKMLPVLIKYMELKYTLALVEKKDSFSNDSSIFANSSKEQSKNTGDIGENFEHIYNAVHRYLAPDEDKQLSQMISAMRTMKNVREMQQMLEMLQSLNPEADKDGGLGNLENLGNLAGFGNLGGMNPDDMNLNINDLMQMLNQNQPK